jgi:hypothetical protein
MFIFSLEEHAREWCQSFLLLVFIHWRNFMLHLRKYIMLIFLMKYVVMSLICYVKDQTFMNNMLVLKSLRRILVQIIFLKI